MLSHLQMATLLLFLLFRLLGYQCSLESSRCRRPVNRRSQFQWLPLQRAPSCYLPIPNVCEKHSSSRERRRIGTGSCDCCPCPCPCPCCPCPDGCCDVRNSATAPSNDSLNFLSQNSSNHSPNFVLASRSRSSGDMSVI